MTAENKDQISGGKKQQPESSSRRRLIKGAAAAPIVLGVASRPVLGNGMQCTASGLGSATHLSHHPDLFQTCIFGCSPGFWGANLANRGGDAWPTDTYTPNTLFKSVFYAGIGPEWVDDSLSGLTLGQVAQGQWIPGQWDGIYEDAKQQLAWHAVSALLNSHVALWGYRTRSGVVTEGFGVTSLQVIEAFRTAYNGGTPPGGNSRSARRAYKSAMNAVKNEFDIYGMEGVVCPLDNSQAPGTQWPY